MSFSEYKFHVPECPLKELGPHVSSFWFSASNESPKSFFCTHEKLEGLRRDFKASPPGFQPQGPREQIASASKGKAAAFQNEFMRSVHPYGTHNKHALLTPIHVGPMLKPLYLAHHLLASFAERELWAARKEEMSRLSGHRIRV